MKKSRFYKRYTIEKELRHHVIEWTAVFFSLFGSILNALQHVEGFYIFIIANSFWISFSWKHKHWGLFVTSIVNIIINFIGIFSWS